MERMNESLSIKVIEPDLEGSRLSISSHIEILELLTLLARPRHKLMRRFTSRTRRLLRIKPKYGSPLSNVVDFGSSKAAMFRWLYHVAHGTLGTPNKHGEDPVTSNSSVKQRNHIDKGNRMIVTAFQVASLSSLILRQAGYHPALVALTT
ncbi:hypothetical protein PIB30_020416 [Stylosanthes scabra]|uniref:Uncharacterized protein n=1 Tax=Stylosanthes scabra TaxID=79078 RepID=A0ABU6S915_9FABA|nr:hypothetical protein [Stylosanthes scabra]